MHFSLKEPFIAAGRGTSAHLLTTEGFNFTTSCLLATCLQCKHSQDKCTHTVSGAQTERRRKKLWEIDRNRLSPWTGVRTLATSFPLCIAFHPRKVSFYRWTRKKSKMSQKLKTENPFWSLLRNKHACAGKSQKFRVHLWSIVFISVSCFDLCVGEASDRDSDLISSRASLTEGSWRREQDTYRVICSGTYLHERGWGGTAAGSGRHRPGPNVGLSYLRAES